MDEEEITGIKVLEAAWWEAIEELRFVMSNSENAQDRIKACDTLLSYTARMNLGLNAPFIPDSRPEEDEEE